MYIKRKISLCLFFLLILCSCAVNEKPMKEPQHLDLKNTKMLAHSNDKNMEDILSGSIEVPPYSEDCYFVPLYINDHGQIAGKTYYHTKENDVQAFEKSLAVLDTKNMTYSDIVFLDDEKNKNLMNVISDKDAFILSISNNYVLYTVYDPVKDSNRLVVTYYIFDLTKHESTNIHEETVYLSQYGQGGGIIEGDTVYLTGATIPDNGIYQYNIKTKKEKKIVDGTIVPSLVLLKDELFYVYSESEKTTVGLNSYSIKTKEESQIIKDNYSETNYVINDLLSDGKDLFLICDRSENNSVLFRMDPNTKEPTPLFETPRVSSVEIFGDYITWMSTPTIEDRLTLQYFVYNYKTKTEYFFKDAYLIGSNAGICWLKYLVPESDIVKGQLYNPANTVLLYKAMK